MTKYESSLEPYQGGITQRLTGFATKLTRALGDMQERHGWWRAFAAWEESGEIDSVLDALGLTEGQIPTFVKNYPEAKRLLNGMTEQIGRVAGSKGDPTWQDMVRVCTLCSSHGQCRAWLRSGRTEGYQDFCPNTPRFARLQASQRPKIAKVAPPAD